VATSIASVVFFSSDPEQLVELLRALDLSLDLEVHDDEIEHWAGEVGGAHIAVYRGEDEGRAPGLRSGGSTFVGVWVDDLDAVQDRVSAIGAAITTGHQVRPWGCRFIVEAADGRAIEVNQRGHCPADASVT